jgi:hypothetical protein
MKYIYVFNNPGLLNTLLYLIINLCCCIRFIDVSKLPEDDQDRLQYVGVMILCV